MRGGRRDHSFRSAQSREAAERQNRPLARPFARTRTRFGERGQGEEGGGHGNRPRYLLPYGTVMRGHRSSGKKHFVFIVIDISNILREVVSKGFILPARLAAGRRSLNSLPPLSPPFDLQVIIFRESRSQNRTRAPSSGWPSSTDRPTGQSERMSVCAKRSPPRSSLAAPPSIGRSSRSHRPVHPTSAASMSQYGNPYAEGNSEYHEKAQIGEGT